MSVNFFVSKLALLTSHDRLMHKLRAVLYPMRCRLAALHREGASCSATLPQPVFGAIE